MGFVHRGRPWRGLSIWPAVLLVAAVWTIAIGIFAVVIDRRFHAQAYDYARLQGRFAVDRDLLYRRWAASHGGVYVPVTPRTPPNPYLAQSPERDIVTPSGKQLTLVNPAYMTRQVYDLGRGYGLWGHITSARPVRPENGPDAWEAQALQALAAGLDEYSGVDGTGAEEKLRLMVPLPMEEGCVRCHNTLGPGVGGLRGGVAVAVPTAPLLAVAHRNSELMMAGLGAVWGAGIAGLLAGGLLLHRRRAERRTHETAVRESEERYRTLSENSPDIIARFDRDGRYLFINRTVERYASLAVADYLGKTNEELGFPPEVCHRWQEALTQTFASGELQPLTFALPRRHHPRIFDCRLVPEGDGGGVQTVLALIRDVTEHRQAEEEVARRERRLNVILETSPAGIVLIGSQGEILFANRRMGELFGATVGELTTLAFVQLVNVDRCVEEDARMQRLIAGDLDQILVERRCLRRDGSSFWGLLAVRRIEKTDGTLEGLIGILSDISDRKAVEDELRESMGRAEAANRAKSEFLANMSHELRTPLNGVLGMLQILETTGLDEEQQEYVAIASNSGWNLLHLINDLLDLSRLETGLLPIVEAPVALRELFESCLRLFYPQAEQQGLLLQCQVGADVPATVMADAARIRQMVCNLLGNAVKFTPSGKVTLAVQSLPAAHDGRVRLQLVVRDTGIGMSAEVVAKIFEPFTQGESSHRRRFQGAGLGLTLVKRLVELMAGSVEIASCSGVGTTVTVDCEVGAVAERQFAALLGAQPDEDVGVPALRILLAEDNPTNRVTLTSLLTRTGHSVHAVENGRQVLDALQHDPYDVVLMDVQMPEMDGIEALRWLRADTSGHFDPGIPVIGVTAYALTAEREAFLAAGMDDCLTKPISREVLEKTLAKCAARRIN